MRKTTSAIIATFMMACLLAAACGEASAPGTATGEGGGKPELTKVTEAGFKVMSIANVYIAKEKGFFEEHGIDFTLQEIDSGKLGVAALISGDAQITDLGLDDVVTLQAQGKPIELFYSLGNSMTMDMVMRNEVVQQKGISPTSPLDDRFAALKGLRIGITRVGAPTDLYARYYMKQVGLDPDKDATFIPIGDGAGLMAALKTGQIDAYMLSAPTPYILENEGIGTVIIKASAGDVPIFKDYDFTSAAVMKSWAEEHPDVLKAYSCAVNEANEWMAANRDEAVQILHDKYFDSTDPETLRIALDATIPSIRMDGKLTEEAIQNQIAVLKAVGVLSGDIDSSRGVLWTDEYACDQ